MAYLPHCQVTVKGTFGNSPLVDTEIWNTGYQISDFNFQRLPSLVQVTQMATAYSDFHASNLSAHYNNSYFKELLVSAIGPAGEVLKNPDGSYAQVRYTLPLATPGAETSPYRPFQVACVVTLVTPRAGAAGRGRCYLPPVANALDANGQMNLAQCQNRANAFRTMLQAVNTALATGTYTGEVVVASSSGTNSKVTSVKTGTVLDTQRRRRNQLQEFYAGASV